MANDIKERLAAFEPSRRIAAGDVDLWAIWRTLVRRRAIALGVLGLSLLAGALVNIRTPRVYSSQATMIIELTEPEVLTNVRGVYDLGSGGYWNTKEYFSTQFRIIKSRAVAERVAARLGMSGASLAEELAALGPESLEAKVSGDVLAGVPESLKNRIALTGRDKTGSREEMVAALRAFDATGYVLGKIQVVPVRDSRLVNIGIEDTDPERAALLANAVADAYEELNLDQKLGFTRSAVDWLSDQVQDLRAKLEASEKALYDFKKDNNIVSVSMEDRQNMDSQTMSQLNQALTLVLTQRRALESKRKVIELARQSGLDADTLDAAIASPLIQRLKQSYSDLRQEQVELGQKYTEDHPKLVGLRRKIALVQQDLNTEIDKMLRSLDEQYTAAVDTERRLKADIDEVKGEALAINKKELDYVRLKRDRDNNAALYDVVIKRQKEADLTQMLRVNNVRKLEAALPSRSPIRPKIAFNFLVALIIGVLGGLGMAFVADFLDNTLKNQEQVEQRLGLPTLGIVPIIKSGKSSTHDTPDANLRDRYILDHPRSSVAECCRTVRTNLLFMSPDRPARAILVTSAGPREGKSTIATSLAVTMAQAGGKVLLVDTDLRRPRLHKSFGLVDAVGISRAILGEVPVDEAIVPGPVPGLDVLPCGPIPPNPAELLHTESFKAIYKQLMERYDRVIWDSPPVTPVTDALVLASMVDGVVLVVNAGQTTWQLASQSKRRIEDVGGRIFGVVLNSVDLEDRHYGRYYRYYYYRSRYTEDESAAA
ncbi:MAG: polysaccharide biosynthesis tyrosine autokinase [Deltaproteobacteria bacterium]|nr:polysaccharide biosynthesis tyrosine autokinase [Deltaproteobacteria bacterium]